MERRRRSMECGAPSTAPNEVISDRHRRSVKGLSPSSFAALSM
jgi:hypothetical protein